MSKAQVIINTPCMTTQKLVWQGEVTQKVKAINVQEPHSDWILKIMPLYTEQQNPETISLPASQQLNV